MRIESGQVKKGEKGVKDPKLIRSITGMEESDGAERERWTSNKQTLKAKKKKSRDFLRDRASDRPISEAGDNEKNQTCWCQSGRRRGGKQAWRNSFSLIFLLTGNPPVFLSIYLLVLGWAFIYRWM